MLQHDSLEAEAGNQSAVQTIAVGARVLPHADRIFGAAKTVTGGTAIEATVPAPVAVTVAVVPMAVATSVTSAGDTAANDEEPPEERAAPRLTVWYEDDAGNKHLIPVIREGASPPTADRFFIRPHGTNKPTRISSVRFYLEWSRKEMVDDTLALKFELSPDFDDEGTIYRTRTTGVEDGIDYFEIGKWDGSREDGVETTLTMRVHDAGAGDDKAPAYYPYYYVTKSVDAEGKVLEEEQFIGDAGFVIHFLDELNVPESQVRIPQHTISGVTNARPTIPAPLVVPTKSMLPKADQAALTYNR